MHELAVSFPSVPYFFSFFLLVSPILALPPPLPASSLYPSFSSSAVSPSCYISSLAYFLSQLSFSPSMFTHIPLLPFLQSLTPSKALSPSPSSLFCCSSRSSYHPFSFSLSPCLPFLYFSSPFSAIFPFISSAFPPSLPPLINSYPLIYLYIH